MFWGLIMEPQRKYTQKVKKAFHISMAALDLSTSSNEPAQVMCGFEGRNYLLCTLKKPDVLQCPLNLNFEVGSEVSFAANGRCHIHLTGFLNDDFTDLEEEEEVEEEEEATEATSPKKSKRRAIKALESGPPSKKSKSVNSKTGEEEEDSDSDDSEDYVPNLLGKSLEEADSDASVEDEEVEGEEEVEEEEDDDEIGLDEDLEEEESSLSEAGSDEEETKPKINGLAKNESQQKKNKKQQEEVKKPQQGKKEGKTPNKENQTPKKKVMQGGVIVEEIREGQGTPAKNGKFVNVYYEGRLKQNNKMFDSATKGAGFSFRLGNGEVIKGWDVGVAGMKIGGKRRITCPPAMAYGQKGSPPAIPPNSTLVFEVELRKVN